MFYGIITYSLSLAHKKLCSNRNYKKKGGSNPPSVDCKYQSLFIECVYSFSYCRKTLKSSEYIASSKFQLVFLYPLLNPYFFIESIYSFFIGSENSDISFFIVARNLLNFFFFIGEQNLLVLVN